MNWLEIIELRAVNGTNKKYESTIKSILSEFENTTTNNSIKIFNRLDLESDISIHILHQSENPDINGSPETMQLVSILKEFGLINLNIWVER